MKRVLSLVLALVLVLGMVPVFANDVTPEAAFAALVEFGFVTGDENGDPMFDTDLTREQMAKIVATINGKGDDAQAFTGEVPYADAEEISAWAKGYVAYAYDAGWMIGDGVNFRPMDPIAGQEMLALLLRVLGDEDAGKGDRWATVAADAAMAGLPVASLAEISRSEALVTIYTAVAVVTGEDGLTIAQRMGVQELPAPVVTDLEVVEVNAVNLGEVDVVFNNMIDEDSIDKANFAVGTKTINAVTLLEDGMTVRISFLEAHKLSNQTAYKVTISEIADVNEFVLKDVEEAFTSNDFAAPVVESVEVKGNKKIDVTFSEPVAANAMVLSNYKINDLLFGGMVSVNGRVVSITLSNRLADGVHSLSVSTDVLDFAGFKVVSNNNQFAVAKEETAPAVAAVEATQTEVKITFTEAVEPGFTVNTTVGTLITVNPVTTKDDVTYTLKYQVGSPLPLSGTEIELKDVTDFYGNKATLKVNVVPQVDLARPEVTSVEVTKQNEIVVTFSKDVDLDLLNTDVNYTPSFVLKTDETVPATVGLTYDYDYDAKGNPIKTVVVLSTGNLTKESYTLEVTGVRDETPLRNIVIPYGAKVAVADLTLPFVQNVYRTNPDTANAGAIYVEFSEKVDAATALDKANYSYTTKLGSVVTPVALGSSNGISLLGDGKTVKITVPKLAAAAAGTTLETVTIINVTDLAENKMTPEVKTLAAGITSGLSLSNPRATAVNKITLDVSGSVNPATVTASDFTIVKEGYTSAQIYVINAEYKEALSGNTIVLTLNENFKSTAEFVKDSVDYYAEVFVQAQNLKDIYGTPHALGTITGRVIDKIAPVVTKVDSATLSGTTVTIVLPVTEDITIGGSYADYLSVVVDNVKYPATASYNSVTGKMTVTALNVPTTSVGKTLKLTYFANNGIIDMTGNANELANFDYSVVIK